jgi:hypothetical protein
MSVRAFPYVPVGRSRWFDLFSGLHWGNAELDAMTRRGVIEQGRFSAAEIESGP